MNHISAKCYHINEGNDVKMSTKGTPRHVNLSAQEFEEALFNNEIPKACFNRIASDRKTGTCITRKVKRKALNPTYLKMRVKNDLISVEPF